MQQMQARKGINAGSGRHEVSVFGDRGEGEVAHAR